MTRKEKWYQNYKLAKSYYEHHGNLEVPQHFRTINGIDYDENGAFLGCWIARQRQVYMGNMTGYLDENQIDLLNNIGMRFETNKNEIRWKKTYELAKKYYKHYGNLEIPQHFRTINGIDYDENGIVLSQWVSNQKVAYNGGEGRNITKEQIKLLNEIGMQFETNKNERKWYQNYELAKKYYEHYGNLEVPFSFKTINGIDYDENGAFLGVWISTQRSAYNGKGKKIITKKQIRLLNEIGMRFETNKNEIKWYQNYELAKSYYNHYGNLEIPCTFKTKNGIDYDKDGIKLGIWFFNQKRAYIGKGSVTISPEKIKLLEQLNIKWFKSYIDTEYQKEKIDNLNKIRKQKEILNRIVSFLNSVGNIEFTKEEDIKKINKELLKSLK